MGSRLRTLPPAGGEQEVGHAGRTCPSSSGCLLRLLELRRLFFSVRMEQSTALKSECNVSSFHGGTTMWSSTTFIVHLCESQNGCILFSACGCVDVSGRGRFTKNFPYKDVTGQPRHCFLFFLKENHWSGYTYRIMLLWQPLLARKTSLEQMT